MYVVEVMDIVEAAEVVRRFLCNVGKINVKWRGKRGGVAKLSSTFDVRCQCVCGTVCQYGSRIEV